VDEAVAPPKLASEGMAEKEAGDGSGASAKSAKSVHKIVRARLAAGEVRFAHLSLQLGLEKPMALHLRRGH
jgi:hypothetical protein